MVKSRKSGKPKVRAIVLRPSKPKRRAKGKVPTQNAFKLGFDSSKIGNSNYGLSVHTQDAFDYRRSFEERGNRGPRHGPRAVNPYFEAWDGQYPAGYFGQDTPDKDKDIYFDEAVATITGSTTFSVAGYSLNPGDSRTFPTMSAEARKYKRYMFKSLEFYFTTLTTPSFDKGRVLMSCDLEAVLDPQPDTENKMFNNTIHADGTPWENFGFQIAGVTRHEPTWYVRTHDAFNAGFDPKTTDIGTLWVGTFAQSGATTLGTLRVRGRVSVYDRYQNDTLIPDPVHFFQVNRANMTNTNLTSGAPSNVTFKDNGAGSTLIVGAPWSMQPHGGAATEFGCPLDATVRVKAQVTLIDNTVGASYYGSVYIVLNGVNYLEQPYSSNGQAGRVVVPIEAIMPVGYQNMISIAVVATFAVGTVQIENATLLLETVF